MKSYITYDELITACPSNVSKMNVFEYLWYFPEMYPTFGDYRKPNIGWFILFLICPWINELYYIFCKDEISKLLYLTIADLFSLIIILTITLCGLGPIAAFIIAYLKIRNAKKFCKKVRKQ